MSFDTEPPLRVVPCSRVFQRSRHALLAFKALLARIVPDQASSAKLLPLFGGRAAQDASFLGRAKRAWGAAPRRDQGGEETNQSRGCLLTP